MLPKEKGLPHCGAVSLKRLFIYFFMAIFSAEIAIMLALNFVLPRMPVMVEVFTDAFLLVAILFPFMYKMILNPLLNQIDRHRLNEAALRKSEYGLKSLVQEKEILLQELHHRVNNNLQIISSLLALQSAYTQNKECIEIFSKSQDRIYSMGLIHEKLYNSLNLGSIDFSDYIKSLSAHLFDSCGASPTETSLVINTDNIFFDVDTAIPCGLIISELVSNSLRHAFPENKVGEISIELFSNLDRFTLIVKDNGIGFPPDMDISTFSLFGLRLVRILANQLDGSVEFNNNNGAEVLIVFKPVSASGKESLQ